MLACFSGSPEKAAPTLIGMAGPLKKRPPGSWSGHTAATAARGRCRSAVGPSTPSRPAPDPPTAEINHTRPSTRKRRPSGCSPSALRAVGPPLGADSPPSIRYVVPGLWCGGRDSAAKPRRLSVGPQSRGDQGRVQHPHKGGVVDPAIIASVPAATIPAYRPGLRSNTPPARSVPAATWDFTRPMTSGKGHDRARPAALPPLPTSPGYFFRVLIRNTTTYSGRPEDRTQVRKKRGLTWNVCSVIVKVERRSHRPQNSKPPLGV